MSAPLVRRLVVHLGLAGLILLFADKMAFSNLILARGDTFLYFYPYWQAAADALAAGRLPLWNPDIFMGAPFVANSQVGFFYPLNWPVWLLLSTPAAVKASILLHLFIAGVGAYVAGRRALALGRPAALLAAALFALGGYLTAQVEHVNQLQGLAWLPWLFAAVAPLVESRADRPGWRALLPPAAAVGALFALQLLAGHTQTAFISGAAVSLWLLLHVLNVERENRPADLFRAGRVVAAGVALAALLAAVQLLPTLELTGQSSRQGGLPLNEVLSFSWHPLHLTRALLPAYGQALFSEYVAFLPLTALGLLFVGAWAWRREPAVRPWLLLLGVMLVLALGRFTPVYYLLGRLPGFELFRAPARWLAVASLAAALLAGYGWQRLSDFARSDGERVAARRELIRPLLGSAALVVLLVVWGFAAGWLARFVPAGAEAPFEYPAIAALLGWAIEFALAALLAWMLLYGPRSRAHHAATGVALLAVAVLWAGSRGLPYNQLTTPEAYFDLRPPQARLLALAACAVPDEPCPAPPDRFLSLSDIFFDPGDLAEIESIYADQLDEAAIYDYVVAVKHKEVLSPNLSMISRLPAIDGFDGGILPLRVYSEMMQLILPPDSATTDGRLREYLPAAPDPSWLGLFNGRYLITDKTGDVWYDGVHFDREHATSVDGEPVAIPDVPPFEATELWLLSTGMPPPVEVDVAGEVWRLAPEPLAAPDLYRLSFPNAWTAEAIRLLPCGDEGACVANALTLVDGRDGAFQPLALPPYRLIFSGDVKIYENPAALPRAFVVHEWLVAGDTAAAVEMMRDPAFDPARAAVVTGDVPFAAVVTGDVPFAATAAPGRGTAEITSYEPERVVVSVATDAPALLVLTDAHYPGWQVTLGGELQPLWQVDGMFRGVFLPVGEHEVVFQYQSRGIRVGAALSAVGLIGCLIVALASIGRRRRRSNVA